MRFWLELRALLYKELLLEYRSRAALSGLLLYVVSMGVVTALALQGQVSGVVWNVVFWLLNLFIALNAMARGFLSETEGQLLYLYQLASPVAILLAKLVYNFALMATLSLLTYALYSLLLGSPVAAPGYFMLSAVVGAAALAATLTFVSAIVSRAGNKTTLMAILSFPILVPQLFTCIRLSFGALLGLLRWPDLLFLLSLTGISVALSVVLFPYLWVD